MREGIAGYIWYTRNEFLADRLCIALRITFSE